MKLVTSLLLSLTLSSAVSLRAQPLNIYTEEWSPISFSVDGKPDGLAVQVVQEIQKRINNPDPIKVVPWARGWKMLTENVCQPILLANLSVSGTRQGFYSRPRNLH